MLLTDKSIKSQIKYQVPWFYNQEYPLFVKFLEYYYQWMEIYNDSYKYGVLSIIDNYKRLKDIDSTLDELVPLFKSQYFSNIPLDTVVSKRVFAKRIVDLYRSKGSLKSISLLLRIILGENVELSYPKTQLARSSHTQIVSYYFVYLNPTSTINYFELVNDYIELNSSSVAVLHVVKYGDVYRLILDLTKDTYLQLKQETEVYYLGELIGTLFPAIDSLTCTVNSNPITEGTVFLVSSEEQLSPAICKVTKVKPGKIDSYEILNRGSGYQLGDVFTTRAEGIDFQAIVSNITPVGEITKLTIVKNNFITSIIPGILDMSKTGYNANINWICSSHKTIEEVCVIDPGINIETNCSTSIPGSQFTVTTSTILFQSQLDNVNVLGTENRLPNNVFWQNHSYVLRYTSSFVTLPRTEIKSLFQPLGSKLFYQKQIDIINEAENYTSSSDDLTIAQLPCLITTPIEIYPQIQYQHGIHLYTTDIPLASVLNLFVPNIDTYFCFETKPELSYLVFDEEITSPDPETLAGLDIVLDNLTNSLELVYN